MDPTSFVYRMFAGHKVRPRLGPDLHEDGRGIVQYR